MFMKLNKYDQFINEEFFRKVFTNYKKSKKETPQQRIQKCVDEILNFLAENDVYDWNKFNKMSPFDRSVIDRLIDSQVRNMQELKEVRFKVRLELSNREQLSEYKDELEQSEEYEKCAQIVKRMSQR